MTTSAPRSSTTTATYASARTERLAREMTDAIHTASMAEYDTSITDAARAAMWEAITYRAQEIARNAESGQRYYEGYANEQANLVGVLSAR